MSETATKPLQTPFRYASNLVISTPVSNLDAAIAWYRDALGFEVVYKLDELGWCELRTPYEGITIGLGQNEKIKNGGATPTFGVEDIDDARRHLEGKDVRFDGETYEVEGMVKLATFYDPDGNAYMLAESLDSAT
jgi:catechol 2,3-dioxygenase-like lactoylglutathione lyase family enzyme